ncbi:Uncharacterised protein [Citrobacter koseri]|uniref:Uncharacterized protein n=1 Tax=Citrobacter koseri TaxID=545 RepID=A0A3S4KJ67_CITKO|nr:Uncharacterised protein [Citrobacter koseri]
MVFHLLAESDNLRQIQPVAVQHMKMQHQRAGCPGHFAVQVIEIAKEVAVKQTKQRDIGDRCQTRRLFNHMRIVAVADAFFPPLP